MNTELMFSSKSGEWITPKSFFNKLDSEFHFTTDVGATKENALCADYLGLDNGRDALNLFTQWGAVNYCNPPYGRGVGRWIMRAVLESKDGKIVVMLLPARVDTKWFHTWVFGRASEVRLIRGRLKFGNGGAKATPAPFPSMVVVYDNRTAHHGTIFSA